MKKIMNQPQIKQNLLVASLFLASFELLKTSIEDRIKWFLCKGAVIKNGKLVYPRSREYRIEVLGRKIMGINSQDSKDYHLFLSSCLWLKDMNVIDEKDIDDLEIIRKQRNDIAHNLVNLLIDDDKNINIELLKKTRELLIKIDRWWFVEVEIPVNRSLHDQTIDEDTIETGSTIILDYLLMIAFAEKTTPN